MIGTISGVAGGHFVGKRVGRKLYNRKLENLPFPKKMLHKLQSSLFKKYRGKIEEGRWAAEERGSAIGKLLGGAAGYAGDMGWLAGRARSARVLGGTLKQRADLKRNLKILGVRPKTFKTKKDLQRHWRDLMMKHHPDKNIHASPAQAAKNAAKTSKINTAYREVQETTWYREKLGHALREFISRRS